MSADDQTFRWVVIVGALVVMPIAAYHRIRSQATGEPLDRRQEGLFILIAVRALGLATMLGLVAYMIDPGWMAWSAMPLPTGLRWCGAALGAVAAGLVLWTLHSLGKNLTDTVVTRREHTLVTHGPYRWVRHPFYGCVALLVLANGLMTANGFILLAGVATLALLVVRTRTEERKLVERFGDAYRAYMERTGRILPRLGRR